MGSDEVKERECCRENFLFSNVHSWQLYGPEYRASRGFNIFYLVWRIFSALFFLSSIISTGFERWFEDGSTRVKWFIYLTNWSFLLFCLYQVWSSVVSSYKFFSRGFGYHGDDGDEPVSWYLKVNWILYELSQAPAILVTLLFWILVFNSEYEILYDVIVAHGINALWILLLDIWITAVPIRTLHFYIVLVFSVTFIIFSVVYDYAGGTNYFDKQYIYSALDWTEDPTWPSVYSVGALLAAVLLHFILFGLCKLRVYITHTGCCRTRGLPQQSDVEIPIHEIKSS